MRYALTIFVLGEFSFGQFVYANAQDLIKFSFVHTLKHCKIVYVLTPIQYL